jgi:hypothetical protein
VETCQEKLTSAGRAGWLSLKDLVSSLVAASADHRGAYEATEDGALIFGGDVGFGCEGLRKFGAPNPQYGDPGYKVRGPGVQSTGTRGTKYGDPGYKVRGPGVQSTGTRGTKYETVLKDANLLVFLVIWGSALLFLLIYFILLQKG